MAPGPTAFSKGTRVVYPNQGVCRVVGEIEMTIAGQSATFLKLARENDAGTVMIPIARLEDVGVRRLASADEIERLFARLTAPDLGPDLNWKTRHRSHGERMAEGDIFSLSEVVKELAALSDLRPLPAKERELYDSARHLLIGELAAALEIDEASAEDAIDFALFPPGVERRKLAVMALDALAELAEGDDLDLDADILADADSLDVLDVDAGDEALSGEDRDGPLVMDELSGGETPVPGAATKPTPRKSAAQKPTAKTSRARKAAPKTVDTPDAVEAPAMAVKKPARATKADKPSAPKARKAAAGDGKPKAAKTAGKTSTSAKAAKTAKASASTTKSATKKDAAKPKATSTRVRAKASKEKTS